MNWQVTHQRESDGSRYSSSHQPSASYTRRNIVSRDSKDSMCGRGFGKSCRDSRGKMGVVSTWFRFDVQKMYRKCRCLILLFLDSVVLALILIILHSILHSPYFLSKNDSFVDYSQLLPSPEKFDTSRSAVSDDDDVDYHQCSMDSCFDYSRCRGRHGFKVYIYSIKEEAPMSRLYQEILNAIRTSSYITLDPKEACLFIPAFDTLDRDKHSADFVPSLPSLSSLPYWNGGRNHLIFVQYSGTWPDYSEVLDFPTGQAMLARASMNVRVYRKGFDISLPLMHKEHPGISEKRSGLLSVLLKPGFLPARRKYLLVFKGKRYLYGQGSRIRSSLYHLHNGRDIILLTTCKHNQDWIKYTDNRCDMDNVLYDRYQYEDLMINSSFCLVPRGRRLGSFRFLEALQASCVPVSLSNGYVLPFSEVLDWSKAALVVDEKQLLQLPYMLRKVSSAKVLSLRLYTQFIWETYFSSVRKIIMTTLEIIKSRIEPQPLGLWNGPPGHFQIHQDFSAYPFDFPSVAGTSLSGHFLPFTDPDLATTSHQFTAVVIVTRPALRESSSLLQMLHILAQSPRLASVVLLWAGIGPPKVMTSKFKLPIVILKINLESRYTKSLWLDGYINTSAILYLHEDTAIITEEIEFGFSVWQTFPSHLVGYFGYTHAWDDIRQQWAHSSQPHNHVSIIDTEILFYHRYYGYAMNHILGPTVQEVADQSPACLAVILNCVVAQYSLAPPLQLPSSRQPLSRPSSNLAQQRTACLNMAVNVFGYMPLLHSQVRLDPVLFKDNVSVFRKEYRKMERA